MSFFSVPVTIQGLFGAKRSIGSITIQTVINESATDVLTITKQPIQRNASITDHAFMEPTTFSTNIYFRDNGSPTLSEIYTSLQNLQSSLVPFTITTPKRVYQNMLISALGQTTDKSTENCLAIQLSCQQIIIVDITVATVPRLHQKNPGKTAATTPAGLKSVAVKVVNLVTGGG